MSYIEKNVLGQDEQILYTAQKSKINIFIQIVLMAIVMTLTVISHYKMVALPLEVYMVALPLEVYLVIDGFITLINIKLRHKPLISILKLIVIISLMAAIFPSDFVTVLIFTGIFFAYKIIKSIIDYCTTEYIVTNKNIIIKYGFIATTVNQSPYNKIENVLSKYSIFEKIFNCGTIVFATANNINLNMFCVKNAEKTKQEISSIIKV